MGASISEPNAESSSDDLIYGSSAPISAINVTPFVDVVLVLLVIFIVTAPTVMKDVFEIKLPKASTGGATKMLSTIALSITKQGQFLLDGQLASPETIAARVRDLIAKDSEAQAILSADVDARHGDLVRAIDLIKSAGLLRFAIQIEHQDER